mgnify:CR=1 FL=1
MIGWLNGKMLETWQQGNRQGVLLACGGIGFEVHLTADYFLRVQTQRTCTLWVHELQRDDGANLFGFEKRQERDLFRTLIGVSGIGPQMALSLLNIGKLEELIEAILQEDIETLSNAQGVGKRTAERLSLELRNKISEFQSPNQRESLVSKGPKQPNYPKTKNHEELQGILESLGYEANEISKAINAVTLQTISNSSKIQVKNLLPDDFDDILKACLCHLVFPTTEDKDSTTKTPLLTQAHS